MDDLGFEQLKISALRKLRHIQLTSSPPDNKKHNVVNRRRSNDSDCFYNEDNDGGSVPVRYMLKEMEIERQAETHNAIQARLKKFKNSGVSVEKNDQEWLRKQQAFANSQLSKENEIMKKLSNYDEVILKKKDEAIQLYRQQKELQRKQKEEELRSKQQLKQNVDKAFNIYKEFSKLYQEILKIMKNCLAQDELKKVCNKEFRQCSSIEELFEETLKLCKSFKISQDDIIKCSKKYEELNGLKQKIFDAANNLNLRVVQSKKPPQEDKPPPVQPQSIIPPQTQTKSNVVSQMPPQNVMAASQNVMAPPQNVMVPPQNVMVPPQNIMVPPQNIMVPPQNVLGPPPNVLAPPQNVTVQPKPAVPTEKLQDHLNFNPEMSQYVGERNFQIYKEVMEFADKHTNSIKSLVDDPAYKQFKFDCKKAINIPVNAISDVNSSHLQDKYNKLHRLLSGQTVIVSDQQINASKHPNGVAFCMDQLAKKFVLQGDLMISSKPEAAFCYASIISSLWNDFPILGNLILAYLYKSCPYLVPFYIPQKDGETDEQFYQRRGYQYINGQIERQDKFLKRMTGIMRLYAAIMITPPKRGQTKIPYNLTNGYRWFVSMLKLEPDLDISATMVYDFLETAGYSMNKIYKRQFTKLIRIVIQDFVPKCSKKCTGGAGTRLELLLTNVIKTGQFEKPAGFSEMPFW